MAGREILYETYWTKSPGQDKLRKTAEARVKALLRDGWHEMAREPAGHDSVRIRFEREGATRPLPPLRRVPEPPPRRERGGRGFGGPGGPGGRGRGGFGGPGGPRGQDRGGPGGPPGGGQAPPPGR